MATSSQFCEIKHSFQSLWESCGQHHHRRHRHHFRRTLKVWNECAKSPRKDKFPSAVSIRAVFLQEKVFVGGRVEGLKLTKLHPFSLGCNFWLLLKMLSQLLLLAFLLVDIVPNCFGKKFFLGALFGDGFLPDDKLEQSVALGFSEEEDVCQSEVWCPQNTRNFLMARKDALGANKAQNCTNSLTNHANALRWVLLESWSFLS